LRRDHHGGGHAVAWIKVQEANALGIASGLADLAVGNADDLAVLADDHAFGFFVHLHDRRYFSVALRCLDIDYALPAAGNQTVLLRIRALAVTVLGHGQDE